MAPEGLSAHALISPSYTRAPTSPTEFTGEAAQPLLISEVRLILQQQSEHEKEQGGQGDKDSSNNP